MTPCPTCEAAERAYHVIQAVHAAYVSALAALDDAALDVAVESREAHRRGEHGGPHA